MAADPTPGRKRRLWRIAAGLVAVPVVLVLAVWGAITLPFVRAQLADVLSAALSSDGVTVSIASLEGSLPQAPRLTGIRVADAAGTWLDIDHIDLDWRPTALLRGRLILNALTVGEVRLDRLPAPAKSKPTAGGIPRLPLSVRLDRLSVARVSLASPVLGEAAVFAVEGSAASRVGAEVASGLAITRIDGIPGKAVLRAALDTESGRLDIAADIDESGNGLVASLLGLPGRPALDVALLGAGTVEDWRGSLRGTAADLGAVDAKVAIDARGPVVVDVRGAAELAMNLPEVTRRLLGDHVDFQTIAAWDGDAFRLTLRDLSMTARALAVKADGSVDLPSLDSQGHLTATLLEPDAVGDILSGAVVTRAEATATVAGSLSHPAVDVTLRLEGAAVEAISASSLVLETSLRPDRDLTAPGLRLGVTGSLRAEGLAGLPPAVALGDAAALTWTAKMDGQSGTVEFSPLVADAGGLHVEATGTVPLDGSAADFGLTARLDDLMPLARANGLADVLRAGRGEAVAHLRGGLGDQPVTASVAGTFVDIELADRDLSKLLGGRVGFAAEAAGRLGGAWTVSDVSVEAGGVALAGQAKVDPAAGRLDAAYNARFPDLSRLSTLAGILLKGALTLEGTARGALAAPSLAAKARVANGRIGGTDWRSIAFDASLDGPPDRQRGKLALTADGALGMLKAGGDVARSADGRVALTNLTANGVGLALTGNLAAAPAGLPLTGTLRLKADDLAPLGALAGLDVVGAGTVAVDLAAEKGGGQRAEAKASLRRLALRQNGQPAAAAGTLEATATLSGSFADPRLTMTATATDAAAGTLHLNKLGLNADGGMARLNLAARLDGRIEAARPLPLSVAVDGVLARDGGALTADVSHFQGKLAERPFSLTAPASFRYADDGVVAGPLSLALDKGRLDAAFRLDAAAIDLSLDGTAIPLDLARIAMPDLKLAGTLAATVAVSGRPESPDGRFRVSADGVTLHGSPAGELPPLAAVIEGRMAAGRLDAQASISGLPATTVATTLQVPVALSVRPPAAGLTAGGSVAARLKLDGDVGAVWALLPIDPHRLGGKAAVDLAIAGPPDDLRISGRAGLTGGVYENLETGTLLNDLAVELTGNGRRLDLARATARDAGGGSFEGRGYVDFATGDPLLALRISLANLNLVHRDDVSATVSGGLALDGRPADLRLSGNLAVEPIEARLVDRLPPGVVTLDVVEVGGGAPAEAKEEAKAAPASLGLDLAVDMPRRFFVRGRGLDSEWTGKLRVTGTASAPSIVGSITPVRGQFDLAGKVFRLEDGAIRFAGGDNLVPDLDLRLVYQGTSVSATLRITGPATDPKLTLSSVPDLPQEEILSRVLFDRSTGNLSAAQALQLANAAATLTGIGGVGGGLLEDIRTRLGVDVLRIGGDDKGANVTAGTYLGDRVFVGATQGTSPASSSATVEVEVTPNLSVETDIGQNAKSRVGVKWKWDY